MLYTRLTSTCFENLAFLLKYSYAVCSATNFHLYIVKVKVKECFMVFKQLVSFPVLDLCLNHHVTSESLCACHDLRSSPYDPNNFGKEEQF